MRFEIRVARRGAGQLDSTTRRRILSLGVSRRVSTAKSKPDAVDLVSVDESNPLTTHRAWQRARQLISDWLGVIGIVLFFLAWELSTRLEILNPFYFPPFSKILEKGYELFASGAIWEHMRAIGRVDGLSDDEIKHVTWITKPEPFVLRERVIGVRERIDYQGNEIVPLNWDDVMEAIRHLMQEDQVDAIAVSLMHAWANPKHEEEIRALTTEADPHRKVYWSFGSSLSQVAGEYARTNTAILNSYLGPTVERYLTGLQSKLQKGGLKAPLLIMPPLASADPYIGEYHLYSCPGCATQLQVDMNTGKIS